MSSMVQLYGTEPTVMLCKRNRYHTYQGWNYRTRIIIILILWLEHILKVVLWFVCKILNFYLFKKKNVGISKVTICAEINFVAFIFRVRLVWQCLISLGFSAALFGFELLDLTNTKALFGKILSVIEKSYLINSINQKDEYRLSSLSALFSFSYDLVLVNEDSVVLIWYRPLRPRPKTPF